MTLVGWPFEAHVGAWIDEKLENQRRTVVVARVQCDNGCEVAARAVASNRQPGGIDAQALAVAGDPVRGRDRINRSIYETGG